MTPVEIEKVMDDYRRGEAVIHRIPELVKHISDLEDTFLDGGRELPLSREELGKHVRAVWIRWAKDQPSPKTSWLKPWGELSEPDREVDRMIGEEIARLIFLADAARASGKVVPR